MQVSFGGHNLPSLVEIGLTDLPKSGGAMAPPQTTSIFMFRKAELLKNASRIPTKKLGEVR